MNDFPLQTLINLINELSEKYNFEEEDINQIQEALFAIENGDEALNMTPEDEVVFPEVEDYEDGEEDYE
jgi:hypothetical protein